MSKLFLFSQICSLIYNIVERRKISSMNRMKLVTSERWNTRTVYHSVKGILPRIMDNID